VREESHLDDMRAAIRGDFERLAARRGGQELMQEPAVEPEEPEEPEEPMPEELAPPIEEAEEPQEREEPMPEELAPPIEEAGESPSETAELPPRRSLLARLLGL
jgi:hypothetical protein